MAAILYSFIRIPLKNECDVVVPEFPNSVPVGIIRWVKKVGDGVAVGETVCLIETKNTVIEIPSPFDGKLRSKYVKDGTVVSSTDKIFRIKFRPGEKNERSKFGNLSAETSKSEHVPKINMENQPAIKIEMLSKHVTKPPSFENSLFVHLRNSVRKIVSTRSEFVVRMTKLRKKSAERLKQSQNEAVMQTIFNEIDMSTVIAFRKAHQQDFKKKYGIKMGFMSTFLKAAAYALQDHPIVNAYIKGNEIIYRNYIDISVPVAIPAGLVVPVIRNVPNKSFADIERAICYFREKGKKGKLSLKDMNGGTFTICNVGVFGSLGGIPIINPPQSAILGMHAVTERPVAMRGYVIIRPMMYVALTFDNRLIDGREAVLFLRKIKKIVEDPMIMITGV
ncbi:unnamed protein product [Nezara viridula]|uniref:Dihydrolipoamide acetyltransferase component of pyruvate dehydrogenase complex n=1 Tax=Nezara viridula TaxID=85310 RepID=A0A9P0HC31_NEZVI|nr:unnamed protein product [Nezara viridula]